MAIRPNFGPNLAALSSGVKSCLPCPELTFHTVDLWHSWPLTQLTSDTVDLSDTSSRPRLLSTAALFKPVAYQLKSGLTLGRLLKAVTPTSIYWACPDFILPVQHSLLRSIASLSGPCRYFLHPRHYTLLATHYTLFTTHYTLHTTYYTLHKGHYTQHFYLHTTHQTLHTTHCILHTAYYTLHTTHCTLFTTHWTLHTTRCTLHPTHN